MGIFTTRCVNPECNSRVRKGVTHCTQCGTGALKGTVSCGSCGKEVRASANFCWNCAAEMSVAAKPKFDNNRWARQPGDFSIRIDIDDVKGCLVKPLIVEHGTRALVFQAGRLAGEVTQGRYDLGGFVQRMSNFFIDQPVSVVLLDAGDVELDLENGGLWTLDKFELGASHRLVVRVADPDSLFVNLIKGRGQVTTDDLEHVLAAEAQMLLEGIVAKKRASELIAALGARDEMEAQLREHLSTSMARLGLSLVQLRFIDFMGEAYEELRQMQGDQQVREKKLDLLVQRIQLRQRLRETLTDDAMHKFKNKTDLENFIRQTEHEIGLKDVIRDDEMKRLTERFEFERDREGILRRIEIENIQDSERREKAWKDLLAIELETDEKHRHKLDRDKATHDEDIRQARGGLDLRESTEDLDYKRDLREQEVEANRLEARSKATAEALLTIIDGDPADRIKDLETLRIQQQMTPEQLLALTARTSPEAAKALAEKYKAEGHLSEKMREQLEAWLKEQREVSTEHADRLKDLMQTAMEQMGAVAKERARPVDPKQTIVTPGCGGTPIIINPTPGDDEKDKPESDRS